LFCSFVVIPKGDRQVFVLACHSREAILLPFVFLSFPRGNPVAFVFLVVIPEGDLRAVVRKRSS
jgi:hypothetical protein